ncbi:MAG: hypothetical protein MZW92_37545 [Comamonadaceae bacterium]|nr:hypothetical protein [Comamonadaceae bacterium]
MRPPRPVVTLARALLALALRTGGVRRPAPSLHAVPRIIAAREPLRLLHDLLARPGCHRRQRIPSSSCGTIRRRGWPVTAWCAVRTPSGGRQMEELLEEMDRTDFSAHCPHGRPVSRTASPCVNWKSRPSGR